MTVVSCFNFAEAFCFFDWLAGCQWLSGEVGLHTVCGQSIVLTFRTFRVHYIPFWDFFRLKIASLGRDNGSVNSSNTDVGLVENVHFLAAASQHRGTSVAEGSP